MNLPNFSLLVWVLHHPGLWCVTTAQTSLPELMPPPSPAREGKTQSRQPVTYGAG